MDVEARHPMTVQALIHAIQTFSSDNERSNVVQNRWLCRFLQPLHDALCEVGNNKLSEENRKDMNAFRAVELEAEIERKRKDMEELERDLKKVRAA